MRRFGMLLWKIISFPFRVILWPIHMMARGLYKLRMRVANFLTTDIEDEPLPDAFAKTIENPMGVFYHLNELRKHLFRGIAFLVVTTALSFTFTSQMIDLLAKPIGGIEKLQAIEVTEALGTYMRVALLAGFALALPYIVFELYLFIAPGISPRSRMLGLIAMPAVVVFFLGGMAFAYFIMLPTALPFLLNFMGISTIPRPASYIGFTTGLMFWIGISFQFPLIIFLLAGLGIVKARVLAKQWRLAIVLIAVLSAAITPTIDPISMSLVMGPLILLYFLSIGFAFIAQRNRPANT